MALFDTTSAVRAMADTGSVVLKFEGYHSHNKGNPIGKFFSSDVFTVAGCDWQVQFYPKGNSAENQDFISFYLVFRRSTTAVTQVVAKFTFTILQQNGLPSNMSFESQYIAFRRYLPSSLISSSGCDKFAERSNFEASEYLKDDAFMMECTVTVQKRFHRESAAPYTTPYGVPIPSSYLKQQLIRLLDSGDGADVTFVVKGKTFKAHRNLLAARSNVFRTMFSSGMRENSTDAIKIEEIEPPVFESMLYFIYSDSFPNLDEKSNDDVEELQKQTSFMAQHLFAAAHRYALESLKGLCEEILHKNLNVSTIESTLALARDYHCTKLEEKCQQFIGAQNLEEDD